MEHRKSWLALSALLFSTSIGNVLAADNERLPVVAQWSGPYKQTLITKYADYSEGVVCYILSPQTVGTSSVNFEVRFDGNNVGAISCVRVADHKSGQTK